MEQGFEIWKLTLSSLSMRCEFTLKSRKLDYIFIKKKRKLDDKCRFTKVAQPQNYFGFQTDTIIKKKKKKRTERKEDGEIKYVFHIFNLI